MRHLYAAAKEPGVSFLIDKAKTYERRRCDHRPEDYPEPLSTKDCLASVVDPKGSKTNKHRYVVASQELEVRKFMRGVLGVPLVYINRSIMIMEPMAGATAENREREERGKFRAGLKRGSGSLKRKREESEEKEDVGVQEVRPKKKKGIKGPKGPNPLAVKKSKKKPEGSATTRVKAEGEAMKEGTDVKGELKPEVKKESERGESSSGQADESELSSIKRKRKRKHKPVDGGGPSAVSEMADEDG
jgi:U3 small nucleolar RNA-associated protein 23